MNQGEGRGRTRVRTLIWAIALVCGCHPDPKIVSFHVTPTHYCPSSDQKIHVDWHTAKGKTVLQIEPDDAREVGARGELAFPAHDTVVTLTVSDGDLHPHASQPVRAAADHPLNALAERCADGWAQADPAEFGGASPAFAPDVHPSMISNKCAHTASAAATCHRRVQVTHASKTWELEPNSAVDISREAVAMAGPWMLQQKLLDGEQCGNDSAAGALEIQLNLEIGCAKGSSHEQ